MRASEPACPCSPTTRSTSCGTAHRRLQRGSTCGATCASCAAPERRSRTDIRIDSAEFVDLTERGTSAHEAGTVEAGRALLARALGLWRGDAYQEFDDVPALAAQKDRLTAYRLTAIEQRVDADLLQAEILEHLGDAQAALGDHEAARAAWEQALSRAQHRAITAERLQRRLDEVRRTR